MRMIFPLLVLLAAPIFGEVPDSKHQLHWNATLSPPGQSLAVCPDLARGDLPDQRLHPRPLLIKTEQTVITQTYMFRATPEPAIIEYRRSPPPPPPVVCLRERKPVTVQVLRSTVMEREPEYPRRHLLLLVNGNIRTIQIE